MPSLPPTPSTGPNGRTVAGGARCRVGLEDGPELRQRAPMLRQQRGVEVDGLLSGIDGHLAIEVNMVKDTLGIWSWYIYFFNLFIYLLIY